MLNFIRQLLIESSSPDFNLQKEYDRLNILLFDGELPQIPLKWNRSLRRAGAVHFIRIKREIEIKYMVISNVYDFSFKQLESILIHEMIHVWQFHKKLPDYGGYHGHYFKMKMDEINAKGYNVSIKENPEFFALLNKDDMKNSLGFILLTDHVKPDDPYAIAVFNVDLLQDAIERMKKYKGQFGNTLIQVYTGNSFILKTFKKSTKVNTIKTFYVLDIPRHDELMENSTLIETL